MRRDFGVTTLTMDDAAEESSDLQSAGLLGHGLEVLNSFGEGVVERPEASILELLALNLIVDVRWTPNVRQPKPVLKV